MWNACRPTFESHFIGLQSDIGDPLLSAYLLEHELRSLTMPGYVGSFWSPPFFYPAQGVLAYSEHMAGVLPLYALARVACSPLLAYQLVVMACLLLCFAAMVWLLRGLGVRPVLAALGAFLFAFGAPRLLQVGHLHILTAFYSPLVLLCLVRLLAAPDRRRLAALLAVLYLQLMSGIYLGWFLLFGLAILVPLALLLDLAAARRLGAFVRHRPLYCALALLAWVGLTYLSFRPFLLAGEQFGYRPWDDLAIFLPNFSKWVSVMPGSVYDHLLPVLPESGTNPWELSLFAGFTLLALGVVAMPALIFGRRRNPEGRCPEAACPGGLAVPGRVPASVEAEGAAASIHSSVREGGSDPAGEEGSGAAFGQRGFLLACGASALIMVALTVVWPHFHLVGWHIQRSRLGGTLWWTVYRHVPGAAAFRAVARIWTVVYLCFICFAMGGTEAALRCGSEWLRRRGRAVSRPVAGTLTAALLILGMAEQRIVGLPAAPKDLFLKRIARVRAQIPAGCRAIYAPVDAGPFFFVADLAAMWAGLEANVPVVNGYSSNFPHGYPNPMRPMSSQELKQWAGDGVCVVSAR